MALRTGTAPVAVGTQALLSEGVAFDRLGLVVVDEQHRFGVAQRQALAAQAGGDGTSRPPALHDGHAHPAHAGPHGLRRPAGLDHPRPPARA